MDVELANLLAARWLMALSLGFHIVLAALGVGMPLLMLVAEWRSLGGDAEWRMLARRWSKAFAVLFAVGAVSGTALSFELGLLWPEFMLRFGPVIGLPFTLEGFAFFLEGIFVGVYLYGWDRMSPRAHWLTAWPIVFSGAISAAFVVTVNAWMNCPRGFSLKDGKLATVEPWTAMFNPASGPQVVHMLLAAYMVTGFLIASVYAFVILRGKGTSYHRRALSLALVLGSVSAVGQAFAGDWAARAVAQTQPVKLAAMESQFKTEANAPLRIGGFPEPSEHRVRFALEIPGGLSLLAYHDRAAIVRGLDDFPSDELPPIAVTHFSFQAMVAIGSLLALIALYSAWRWLRGGWPPTGRKFLMLLAASGPLSVVALEAGWIVTEVGRQPWIVHGVMRTSQAVTKAPGIVGVTILAISIYTILIVSSAVILIRMAKQPLLPGGVIARK